MLKPMPALKVRLPDRVFSLFYPPPQLHGPLLLSHSVMSIYDPMHCSPWDFPGRDTGVGCHFLLQGIFPTQGSNLHLLQVSCIAGGFFTAEPWGRHRPCWRLNTSTQRSESLPSCSHLSLHFISTSISEEGFPSVSAIKNPLAMQETCV